jgi:hypothetical protein
VSEVSKVFVTQIGTVVVESEPTGKQVYLSDQPMGSTNLIERVAPGDYDIAVLGRDGKKTHQRIRVNAGQKVELHFDESRP